MTSKILHLSSWAVSEGGAAIDMYVSHHKFPDRPLLFIGGVHGDEPEGVRLASDLLEWLQNNHSQSELRPWALIPCLNIDGFKLNQRTNSRGVDLNRNFPATNWSLSTEQNRYYSGASPNSERETQALVSWIRQNQPCVIIHFHSWEPCVVYTGDPGRPWSEAIAQDTPYQSRPEIGYSTPGSLGDFGWFNAKIPVICVEAQEKSNLDTVWPIFGSGLQRILSARDFTPKV